MSVVEKKLNYLSSLSANFIACEYSNRHLQKTDLAFFLIIFIIEKFCEKQMKQNIDATFSKKDTRCAITLIVLMTE